MSLNLDPRQRAMLEAMHIKLWQPEPVVVQAVPVVAPEKIASGARPEGAENGFGSKNEAAPITPAPPASRPARATPTAAPAPAPAAAAFTPGPTALSLLPPQLLYTHVDPSQAPALLGADWLVVAEADGDAAHKPLAGDAGRLLDNMLRAMQLQHHPRVHHMALARSASGDAAPGHDLQATLAYAVAALQPAMVLVMGRLAAQTLLQRREPLGQLRGQVHSLHGVPAIVTFDAPYLLRAQADKARAWADLCLALSVVEKASAPAS